ncbi:MAG TPA: lysylphosphatidylglycerol synthase transmembrane domain-containing protein [Thermomicrobiales bacterium]|nr:lysylphosphatidylglycerol synthase transmembrane domain-containing protein [Thermomicrobiales bacterium]
MLTQLRRRVLIGVIIGVLVMMALVLVADAGALMRALRDFEWWLLPAVMALTLLNYALRFVKWQFFLRVLGVTGLTRGDSALIFVAAFTMVMTPGKVGEFLKSYLVKLRSGAPMTKTAPIIFAERFSDGVAMLVLAGVGLTAFRYGWQVLIAGAVVSVAAFVVIRRERWMQAVLRTVGGTRIGKGRAESLETLYRGTRSLLRPRPFGIAIGIGVVSWFGECVALFLVLIGLGVPASWNLLLAATFVFAAATWIGGVSMLPGGLGAADVSVAGLLLITVNDPAMTASLAATATLLIRFATLWFGVLVGVLAMTRVAAWPGAVSSSDATTTMPSPS